MAPFEDGPGEMKATYGQGFDPTGVQPETGFKPITSKVPKGALTSAGLFFVHLPKTQFMIFETQFFL